MLRVMWMDLGAFEAFRKRDLEMRIVEKTEVFPLGGIGGPYGARSNRQVCLTKPTFPNQNRSWMAVVSNGGEDWPFGRLTFWR